MRPAVHVLTALLALACAWPACAHAQPAAAPEPMLTRRDAVFALATTAAVTLAAFQDRHATAEATEWSSSTARALARGAEHLGNPAAIAPALLAVDAAARLTHLRPVAAASERIALSIGAAGVTTLALKLAIGRARPYQSPDDAARFRPFSGHDSFPSGHTTIAFALASALDAETGARWVPCLAYPLAALTGWSRVRDDRHWLSDVIAGAAVGGWVARKVDTFASRRWPDGLLFIVVPSARGVEASARLQF